jgi:hypothetical protein
MLLFCIYLFYTVILNQPCFSQERSYSVSIENGKAIINPESYIKQNPKPTRLSGDIYSLNITADFLISYLWIFNQNGIDIFNQINSDFCTVQIPRGFYNIILGNTSSEHSHTFLSRDSIQIYSDSTLVFSKNEATFSIEYKFQLENLSELRINTISFLMFNNMLDSGLHIRQPNIDSTSFLFNYNNLPRYFDCEWAVKGKQLANQGNLYLLNGQMFNSDQDTLITNDPINFNFADFYYHLPDSINKYYQIQLFTFNPSSHQMGPFDKNYKYPFTQRIYQDTSTDLFLRSSIFWQTVSPVNILYGHICTPEIRIKKDDVQGFYYIGRNAPSFSLSETRKVQIGLTPTYWFGKFVNEEDTIKIRSPYGRWNYLFLSQTNDILRHYPIEYSIYSEDSLYLNGQFHLWFEPVALRLGFDSTGLTIPVKRNNYEMIITDNQNEVAAYPGISQVKATFSLNTEDKNPPFLSLFQISSDGDLVNILEQHSENIIRFRLEDDNEVLTVELFYTTLKGYKLGASFY